MWRPMFALAAALLAGCPGGVEPIDAGPPLRGPEGGVVRFDAAMLVPVDAGPAMADVGPRIDAGRDGGPTLDAGRRCSGVARSCSSFGASSSCVTQNGCTRGGECNGVSRSCYSIFSSFACSSHDGCIWDSSRDECNGSARNCSGYFSSSSCSGQDDCRWDTTCDGVASSCFGMSPALCTLQEGCYLE